MSLCLECHPCWPAHSKIIPPSLLCFLLRGRGLINSGCAETRPFPKRAPPYECSLRASSFYFGAGLIGLLVLPYTEVDGGVSATCGGCRPCRCGRHSHPTNHGRANTRPFPRAMARRNVRRSVRTKSRDGPSLRSQATTGPCGLSSAGATRRPSTFCAPFLCAPSASKGNQPARTPLIPVSEEEKGVSLGSSS